MAKNNIQKKTLNFSPVTSRIDFSQKVINFEEPNLLEVQVNSYDRFLKTELDDLFKLYFPIYHDKNNRYIVEYRGLSFVKPNNALTPIQAIQSGKNYEYALYLNLALVDNQTGKVNVLSSKKNANGVSDGIFFGNIPRLTTKGTFIVNGIEKNVLSQIVRSPGMYVVNHSRIKSAPTRYSGNYFIELIPTRGTTMHFFILNNYINCTIRSSKSYEKPKTYPVTYLLKAFGMTSDEILSIFNNHPLIVNSLRNDVFDKDNASSITDLFDDDKIRRFRNNSNEENNDIIYSHIIKLIFEYKEANNGDFGVPQNKSASAVLDKIISEWSAHGIINDLGLVRKLGENSNGSVAILLNYFFKVRTYNLGSAGRYKLSRKFRVIDRLYKHTIANDILSKDNKVVFKAQQTIFDNEIKELKDLIVNDKISLIKKIPLSNKLLSGFSSDFESVTVQLEDDSDIKNIELLATVPTENSTSLLISDIISIVSYAIGMYHNIFESDDIEHIGNKRLRLIHEQLCTKLASSLSKIEKYTKEKLSSLYSKTAKGEEAIKLAEKATIKNVINSRLFQAEIKNFFNTYSLTQYLDQQNPLSELSSKRRISAMGDGGIKQSDPNLNVRDIQVSQYGRICPIESPEGLNVGLVLSLGAYTRIDDNGFLISPFYKVENGVITDKVEWLTALKEEKHIVANFDVPCDENNKISVKTCNARLHGEQQIVDSSMIEYTYISPKQILSISTGLIPFVEHDEGHRAEMGSNMQRQALPLIYPHAPSVGVGSEYRIAHNSNMGVAATEDGTVSYVDGKSVVIGDVTYPLNKYIRTNQFTCNNQVPIVNVGDKVKANQVIADGPAMNNGELSLGQNILVAFHSWNGYNFEDAIVLSERLVKNCLFNSIYIQDYNIVVKRTLLGDQKITRDIPGASDESKALLSSDGIISIGAHVKEGDILVGMVEPKPKAELTAEDKLIQALFETNKNKEMRDYRDVSCRAEYGVNGTVYKIDHITENLDDDQIEIIRVYIAQCRQIQVGDKLSGRHGNKGVISIIVPEEDMPFLPDGTPIDICLNPHGVPSRMNIGQVLELHMGYANRLAVFNALPQLVFAKDIKEISSLFGIDSVRAELLIKKSLAYFNELGWKDEETVSKQIQQIDLTYILNSIGMQMDDLNIKIATPVFNGASISDVEQYLSENGIDYKENKGKFKLRDGLTGEFFDNPIAIGLMYMLKLNHMVEDKIHARSIGPYSHLTQQPLGGKSQNGGQRCGEMEVWAFQAYGAAYNLRELMTIKSDDVLGRSSMYRSIIDSRPITPFFSIPDAFKLVSKNLQGLGIKIDVITNNGNEIDFDEFTHSDIRPDKDKNILASSDYNEDSINLKDKGGRE